MIKSKLMIFLKNFLFNFQKNYLQMIHWKSYLFQVKKKNNLESMLCFPIKANGWQICDVADLAALSFIYLKCLLEAECFFYH